MTIALDIRLWLNTVHTQIYQSLTFFLSAFLAVTSPTPVFSMSMKLPLSMVVITTFHEHAHASWEESECEREREREREPYHDASSVITSEPYMYLVQVELLYHTAVTQSCPQVSLCLVINLYH